MSAYDYEVPDFDFTESGTMENEDIRQIDQFLENQEDDVFATPRNGFYFENDSDEKDLFSSPTCSTDESSGLRRSMSVGNLHHDDKILRNAMNNLAISESSNDVSNAHHNGDAQFRLPSHSITRSNIDLVRRTRFASQDINPKKFVSMAEAINNYQQKTPQRFRSKSKLANTDFSNDCKAPAHLTVPQSPALQTKNRTRPVSAISMAERELKDFQEAQKFQIKANPLNCKVLSKPHAILKSTKTATIPEPFNLTAVPRRKSTNSSPSFEFRARSLPKFIKEPLKPRIKTALFTNPRTPTVLKRTTADICTKVIEPVKPAYKGGPTRLIPFSFDDKIDEVKKKKEKMLNEVLEKEKKAREFRAQPIPKIILKNQGSNLSLNKLQENDRTKMHYSDYVDVPSFKAKPATVLVKPPFVPKLSSKPLTEIVSYPKNSIKRASEREKFYEHLREKEEMVQQAREERELEKQRLEDEKIAELRKLTTYQAQPIRQYKRVKSVTPKNITNPISPKFSYVKNKENIINSK